MKKEEKNSNKCPICGRPTHKESKYCIFHAGAEEKTEEEFKQALKEYIQEIKKEDKDYNFEGFIFVGDINFNNIEFNKDLKFINAKFIYGSISFIGTQFKEKASFLGLLFNGTVDFSGASFRKEVEFKGTNFEGGSTSFKEVYFSGDVSFEGNIFQNNIDFSNAQFHGNFNGSFDKFNGSEINFNCADINHNFDICLTEKKHINLNFESITTYFAFTNITLIVKNGGISFRNTLLDKMSLCFEIYNDSYIDFEGARIKDTVIRRDHIEGHIIQENKKSYDKAKEIYITLKNNFHSIGRYDDESWAYKKEKDMERKSNCHFKTLHKWLWSCFLNGIFGYGEKPERVIFSATAIIIIFAFVFMNFGIDANPQSDTIPKYNILKELFMGIRYGDLLVRLKGISLEHIKNCFYFSTVTFTTLGLGDFRPVEGWGRIFVGTEAFIGALMMALFVYTFARRTGGR
jgi:hypothetical protein